MTHPLENTRLKLDRADKHLNELKTKVDGFANRQPYDLIRDDKPELGYYVYDFRFTRTPPRRWGVIIGDITHNLRSALDHLAWALASLTVKGGRPSRDTAFPIFTEWKSSSPKPFQKMVRQMPPASHKIIERLQPHNDGDLAGKHPLAILAYLSNRDKHQLLAPIGTILNAPTRAIPGPFIRQLNRHHVRIYIPTNVQTEVAFEPEFTFQIAVGVPAFSPSGVEVFRLRDISQFIRHDVVPRFTGFFPPP